ncbi:heme-binding protein [Homoserinimonas sp. OAct 916]|uniref:SOUL family heme-binding protein n=1 Tax=Homoserinimonas sp. OAct 916 TaxID=2211450 RepID=UPI000DBE7D78|nr:heme-binding protein [Homoserinimonas sp. OAct 916]
MTEQQPYDVVRSYDLFELRRYPEHLVAEVIVGGPFKDAGNRAFRYLFAYISGENASREKVAMTAPVIQEDSSSSIAMTAPVLQQQAEERSGDGAEGSFVVAFVLPAALSINSAPRPKNDRVQLRVVAEGLVAAIRYRGRWTEEGYVSQLAQLRSAIAAAGFSATGEPRFARFDPPFRPSFLRRNEVMLDVDGADSPDPR